MSSNNLLKTFNKSGIFYKMHENFPSMPVSVRMYQIACVSHRMCETLKVCISKPYTQACMHLFHMTDFQFLRNDKCEFYPYNFTMPHIQEVLTECFIFCIIGKCIVGCTNILLDGICQKFASGIFGCNKTFTYNAENKALF